MLLCAAALSALAQARCAGGAAGGPPPGVRRGRPRKLPFRDARVWVRRNLCFEGRQDWEDYLRDGKKTPYLPDEPDVYYASQVRLRARVLPAHAAHKPTPHIYPAQHLS